MGRNDADIEMEEGGVTPPPDTWVAQSILDQFGFIVMTGSVQAEWGDIVDGKQIMTRQDNRFGHKVVVKDVASAADLEAQEQFVDALLLPFGRCSAHGMPVGHKYLYKVVAE